MSPAEPKARDEAGRDGQGTPGTGADAQVARLFERHGPRYKWLATLTVILGTLSMAMTSTIVNVAFPDIMRGFGVGHDQTQWLATGFLAAMASAMLVNAWAVNAFGPRATYTGAMAVFLVASVVGGLSPVFELLVAARVLQGAMAGIVQPLGMVILYEVFPPAERGRGMGIYGLGVVLGPAVGPVIGGMLVDAYSWRAIFLMIPLPALAALALAWVFLRGRDRSQPRPRLDFAGLLMLAASVTTMLWSLANGERRGWDDGLILAGLLGAAALAVAFLFWEAMARQPLLNLRIFRCKGFGSAFLISMSIGAGLFGSTYLLPVFVQHEHGLTASAAGLMLMPAGLAMAATFPVAGLLTDRLAPTTVLASGTLLCLLSGGLLAWEVAAGAGITALVVWTLVGRVGLGLMMTPTTAGALRLLERPLVPQGSGAINFARQFGGAAGVNLLAILVARGEDQAGVTGHGAYETAFWVLAVLFAVALVPLWRLHRSGRVDRPTGAG
ncbi:DHA2 family efflux MFS transporter permease subunit [Azospirillum sp. SYSU D00513]|uniref:DHA2 family efflux MFS transporter permease subunit n=1 Tax=Azospirillum sp. SYSU D00513 TaxID=2812561 RepID=UPI001A959ECD|nr:DHA2 family efflux MFS transporter permease subunit [Azospirillum sp. SYSU D00513]